MNGTTTKKEASILVLAAPLILSFWMRTLFNFVDAGFAASLGDHAVAAIGLAAPLEFLLIACWVGTSTGMTSLLSRAIGAREGARVTQIIRATWKIVAVLMPLFALFGLGLWFLAPHLTASGDGPGLAPDVVEAFKIYGTVMLVGTAITGFWSIIPDSIVKAHHDMKTTMWSGILSNVLNVSLNALFLFVFHWGIFGIAFSTVLGRLAGLAYAHVRATAHERRRMASETCDAPGVYASPLRAMAPLAIPAALTYGLVGLESLAVNGLLTRYDNPTETIAAFAVYTRWVFFFIMPLIACGVALLPFVGRAWGRRDVTTIRAAFRQVAGAAAAYTIVVVTPLTLMFRDNMVALFAESALTERFAADALLAMPFACLASIPFFACRPVFEGMQRGFPGLVVASLRYLLLTGPCALGFALLATSNGITSLHGVLTGLVVSAALASAVFLAWMLRSLDQAERDLVTNPEGA